MARPLLTPSFMKANQTLEVCLIDSDDKLARLLGFKLKTLGARLRHIKPEELNDRDGQRLDNGRESAVVIDLPQRGTSDRRLMDLVGKAFPGVPLIKLLSPGAPFVREEGNDNEHAFIKPLLDLTPFLNLILKRPPPLKMAGPAVDAMDVETGA